MYFFEFPCICRLDKCQKVNTIFLAYISFPYSQEQKTKKVSNDFEPARVKLLCHLLTFFNILDKVTFNLLRTFFIVFP